MAIIFLFGNQPLIDFQIGNEPYIVHGDHFLYEKRPLIDFQIGNEPDIVHGDIHFQGDDATENGDFQREKQRLQGSKKF